MCVNFEGNFPAGLERSVQRWSGHRYHHYHRFGPVRHGYVGTMKGVIYTLLPDAKWSISATTWLPRRSTRGLHSLQGVPLFPGHAPSTSLLWTPA